MIRFAFVIVKFVWLDFVLFMSLAAISDLSLKFVDLS